MRKALIVGIDYYDHASDLYGCTNDAKMVRDVLARNENGTVNFTTKILLARDKKGKINTNDLRSQIRNLFEGSPEVALLYFSGHGYVESAGGYIVSSDSAKGSDGVSMNDIIHFSTNSKARHKIIILDCCHSGAVGNFVLRKDISTLGNEMTILAASSEDQYAMEQNGGGVFTNLLVDALMGSSANLLGLITPASVYAHIDQSLGAFEQRPIFKTNTSQFITIRKVKESISLPDLRKITSFFKNRKYHYPLSPIYEFTSGVSEPEKVKKFKILQQYNRINLVVPEDEEHMYFAAMNYKSCKLTLLGQHYWNLVKKARI